MSTMATTDDGSAEEICLPPAPRGLCFDRLDFVKSKFSVDELVGARGQEASLERLRDDLGAYLKVLRLAMIELINRDYANFVSLSATLVGFDRAVRDVRAPLESLREEVLSVESAIGDTMKELAMWRGHRGRLRQNKLTLQHYGEALVSLRRLADIVRQLEEGAACAGARADRAAQHHARLRFALAECRASLPPQPRASFDESSEQLARALEETLLAGWQRGDEAAAARALATLAALGRAADTHALLRRRAVAPLLRDLLSEASLQRAPAGLRSLYDAALALLDTELRVLRSAAARASGYDFVVECFWSEAESRLELQLASVFAPGDPRLFHARYSASAEFVRRLEERCGDPRALRSSPAYASFRKRWNLPVYFQIRFQEIAGGLEASLLSEAEEAGEEGGWRLRQSAECWRALQACWADHVFLHALSHKFWKLSLQLLSRYASWVVSLAKNWESGQSESSAGVRRGVAVCADVRRMRERVPEAVRLAAARMRLADTAPLQRGALDADAALAAAAPAVEERAVEAVLLACSAQLRRVSDVPRLYRKTNRSVPSAPGAYLAAVAAELGRLRAECAARLDEPFAARLLERLFERMTDSYYSSVEEVLTSVQKTEESLRRLKQVRGGGGGSGAEAGGGGMSDGDKIRLQVSADAAEYCALADAAGVQGARVARLHDLRELVSRAVQHIHRS